MAVYHDMAADPRSGVSFAGCCAVGTCPLDVPTGGETRREATPGTPAGARRERPSYVSCRPEAEVSDLLARITTRPEQCGGRPCIRGMRIRVIDVLDLLAEGLTEAQVVTELPDLEPEDVRAALHYAARQLDRPVLAA